MIKVLIIFLLLIIVISCNDTGNSNSEIKQENKIIETEADTLSITEKIISNAVLSYSIIKTRASKELKNDSLKTIINNWLKQNENANIDDMVNFNLELTKNQLSFTFDKCPSELSKLIKTRKANCIGYSALFNSLMNYTLIKKQLDKRYECIHYVGKIYYAGQNINSLFNDPFFKDHDFNIINDIENKQSIAVDPSLYEYLGIKRVTIKK